MCDVMLFIKQHAKLHKTQWCDISSQIDRQECSPSHMVPVMYFTVNLKSKKNTAVEHFPSSRHSLQPVLAPGGFLKNAHALFSPCLALSRFEVHLKVPNRKLVGWYTKPLFRSFRWPKRRLPLWQTVAGQQQSNTKLHQFPFRSALSWSNRHKHWSGHIVRLSRGSHNSHLVNCVDIIPEGPALNPLQWRMKQSLCLLFFTSGALKDRGLEKT